MIGLWLLLALQTPAMAGVGDEPVAADPLLQGTDGLVGEPGPPVSDADELDRRTRDIGLIIRCPVCQGLSIADSSSDAAVAMRNRVRELVAAGYSDQQVLDFFAERYGEFILLAPPKEGMHWLLWVVPLGSVAGGLFWLFARARRGEPAVATPEPTAEGGDEDPYRARILAELGD